MEINEDGFIEELLALRRETWVSPNGSTDEINSLFSPTTSWSGGGCEGLDSAVCAKPCYQPFSSSIIDPSSCLDLGDYYVQQPVNEGEYSVSLLEDGRQPALPYTFNLGLCSSSSFINNTCISKSKVKKVEGQPSKNLMAERRRRKRLNDRLAMLRSVVPKISKMDRTSILGDTIDYMKELLEKINNLQEDVDDAASNQFNVLSILKDVKPTDILVRNSPKFDVERKKSNTRVEICCAGKPGLLLSTVTTLEALGLEIRQCVISCFSDFSLQASCSQGSLLGSEDIKQALFRNAGYGGRCL